MKFSVYKGEKEISDLAARVFDIKGRNTAEARRKAEAALLSANPHIRNLAELREGTLIVVPELPESPPPKATQAGSILDELGDHLTRTMKELEETLSRSVAYEESEAAAVNEALKSRELREFMGQSPETKEQLERIADAAKNRLKEAKAAAAAQEKALAELQEALRKIDF